MPMSKIEGGLFAAPNFGGTGRLMDMWNSNNIYFVDAVNGSSGNPGKDPETPFALPSEAVSACAMGASIYIKPYIVDQSATSQAVWYTDDIIIPYDKSGIALIGCGNVHPYYYAGVGLKPSTVTGPLIENRSNGNLFENLHLTLTGGTADQAAADNHQSIIVNRRNITASSYARTYGGTIRGCRIEADKSHPHPDYGGSLYFGCSNQWLIEDNVFINCLGPIIMQSVIGSQTQMVIRNNQFGGLPSGRGCDITLWINNDACNCFVIRDNCFGDGLPNHTGSYKRFIYMPTAYTSGSGIVANNYFATKVTQPDNFDTDGSEAWLADKMFAPGNYYEGITTAQGHVTDDA